MRHVLSAFSDEGHVYAVRSDLVKQSAETLGVDAQLGAAAMGGLADRRNLQPHKAFVRDGELQFGGLGDDRCVGLVARGNICRADAGILFVGYGGEQQIAC